MEDVLKKTWVKKFQPFGSRVVGCATEKSDYDYLVLVDHKPHTDEMAWTGFNPDSGDPLYGEDFSSWKKGDINLVFTDSEEYYKVTLEACEFCKKYKVFDKADRCKVHEVFRDAAKLKATTPDLFLGI